MIFFSLVVAILPTLFLVWMIWWADRYEREPTHLLILAFAWGALPAIFIALAAELVAGAPFNGNGLGNALVQSALIAPVVEEIIKGLALLGLIRFSRPEIDGVLDGIVYGALVGAGFAMSENFFYFLSAIPSGDWMLTVFLRAILFGLNHIFYTAIFGAAVGYAIRFSNRKIYSAIMLLGLLLAISAHGFHNFAVTLTETYPPLFLATLLMNWGGVLVMLLIVLASLQQERNAIKNYLDSNEAPALSSATQKKLLALLPPKERLLPNWPWLTKKQRQENQLYQAIAELSLRRQRIDTAPPEQRQRLQQEMDALQQLVHALLAAPKLDYQSKFSHPTIDDGQKDKTKTAT